MDSSPGKSIRDFWKSREFSDEAPTCPALGRDRGRQAGMMDQITPIRNQLKNKKNPFNRILKSV
jgi:hypothetical protein